jgi:acyl-CoA synthetase (AMP-forming)/AMP-acid ligase II
VTHCQLLHELLTASAASRADHEAVREATGGASISYGRLDQLPDQLRDHLGMLGVRQGDRVGICLPKSIDAVAAISGILKAGAAYVPVDCSAPTARNATILADCSVRVLLVEERSASALSVELAHRACAPHWIKLPTIGVGEGLEVALLASGVNAHHNRPSRLG